MSDRLRAEDSEQALLGACMRVEFPEMYGEVASRVAAGDWWVPAHELLWRVFADMHEQRIILDPVFVLAELERRGEVARAGGAVYLHTLLERAAAVMAVAHHAERVADAASRRRLRQAGERIAQRANEDMGDVADIVQWSTEQVAAARDERAGVAVLTVSYREFLNRSQQAPPAVIPGLLGEGDRLVMTGSGGIGKSTFLAQVALCAAGGVPPLHWRDQDTYEPVRVTIYDCENPDHKRKTRYWPVIQGLKNMGCDPEPMLTIGGNGASFDLLDPRNQLSLLRTVEHDKPQLLYIGPAYKLHNDDPDKEAVVKKITGVLDSIREMGVALITEAHPNKSHKSGGPMSPSGSALWEWWPEFGVGLRLDPDSDDVTRRCKLERWRVDRDASEWPLFVEASGDPALPWQTAAVVPGYFETDALPDGERWGSGGF